MPPLFPVSLLLFPLSALRTVRCIARRLARRFGARLAQGHARHYVRRAAASDLGQTTAEYGLVILAAGSLALAAILWARNSGSITSLFQSVIDQLTGSL